MLCPNHKTAMGKDKTKYGWRWQCQAPNCTVACWDGGTSTPADCETREARHRCHLAFDPLWKNKSKFKNRNQAYSWLQRVMGLNRAEAHIGMFDLEQCELLMRLIANGDDVAARGKDGDGADGTI